MTKFRKWKRRVFSSIADDDNCNPSDHSTFFFLALLFHLFRNGMEDYPSDHWIHLYSGNVISSFSDPYCIWSSGYQSIHMHICVSLTQTWIRTWTFYEHENHYNTEISNRSEHDMDIYWKGYRYNKKEQFQNTCIYMKKLYNHVVLVIYYVLVCTRQIFVTTLTINYEMFTKK